MVDAKSEGSSQLKDSCTNLGLFLGFWSQLTSICSEVNAVGLGCQISAALCGGQGQSPLDWQTGMVVPQVIRGNDIPRPPVEVFAPVLERRLHLFFGLAIEEHICDKILQGAWEFFQQLYMHHLKLGKLFPNQVGGNY